MLQRDPKTWIYIGANFSSYFPKNLRLSIANYYFPHLLFGHIHMDYGHCPQYCYHLMRMKFIFASDFGVSLNLIPSLQSNKLRSELNCSCFVHWWCSNVLEADHLSRMMLEILKSLQTTVVEEAHLYKSFNPFQLFNLRKNAYCQHTKFRKCSEHHVLIVNY
mgnify:CR=1 FL=1